MSKVQEILNYVEPKTGEPIPFLADIQEVRSRSLELPNMIQGIQMEEIQEILEFQFGHRIPDELSDLLALPESQWNFISLPGDLPLIFADFDTSQPESINYATKLVIINRALRRSDLSKKDAPMITSFTVSGKTIRTPDSDPRILSASFAASGALCDIVLSVDKDELPKPSMPPNYVFDPTNHEVDPQGLLIRYYQQCTTELPTHPQKNDLSLITPAMVGAETDLIGFHIFSPKRMLDPHAPYVSIANPDIRDLHAYLATQGYEVQHENGKLNIIRFNHQTIDDNWSMAIPDSLI